MRQSYIFFIGHKDYFLLFFVHNRADDFQKKRTASPDQKCFSLSSCPLLPSIIPKNILKNTPAAN